MELEAYPTQDLITEIMKRCSPAVFIGTKYTHDDGKEQWSNFTRWQGNPSTCYGMCHELAHEIHMASIEKRLTQ